MGINPNRPNFTEPAELISLAWSLPVLFRRSETRNRPIPVRTSSTGNGRVKSVSDNISLDLLQQAIEEPAGADQNPRSFKLIFNYIKALRFRTPALSIGMKIKEACAGVLSNFEVLDFLRDRNSSKSSGKGPCISQSELKVYEYLVGTVACNQTRESINDFLEKCKDYDLAKAEIVNIVNIRTASAVEVCVVVDDYENRLGDDKVAELAELVEQVLPPAPANNVEETMNEEPLANSNAEEETTNEDPMEAG